MSTQEETVPATPHVDSRLNLAKRLGSGLEENGFLVVILGVFTLGLVLILRRELIVDSWLALVAGRWIVQHGLPSHDTLTVMAHGRRWVDQQWLAQLAFYGLWRLGGVKLALLVNALLAASGIAGAALVARRLGATARSVAWVAIPAYFVYYPVAWVMRPQTFAFPLLVAVLWLLLSDARRPSRRVFAALPLLALWTNLHGSVAIGCVLVSLHGIVTIVRQRRPSRRGLILLLAPWACVFATPYALHLPGYYEKVLVGADFGRFVSEWAPTTLTATMVPAYLLVLGGLWLLGRAGRSLPVLDQVAFVAVAVLAFQAVRDTGWMALVAVVVLPRPLDQVLRQASVPRRLNRLLGTTVLAAVAVSVVAVAARPTGWFTTGHPAAAARATADAAGARGRVFASGGYADWLLWVRPGLGGRVAFDARYELLSREQLQQLARFQSAAGDWLSSARRYRVFVLGPTDRALASALVRALRARVIFSSPQVVVLRARAAGRATASR